MPLSSTSTLVEPTFGLLTAASATVASAAAVAVVVVLSAAATVVVAAASLSLLDLLLLPQAANAIAASANAAIERRWSLGMVPPRMVRTNGLRTEGRKGSMSSR